LVISQLISDFGRTANLTAASRFQAQSEAEKAQMAKAVVLYQVDKTYFKTLEAEALLTVAQQTVDARQVVLDQVSALVKGKLKADLDLSIAKVSVGQAKLLVVQGQNAVDEAEAELSAALGCQKPHLFTLVDEPQYPLPAVDMQELVDQALRYRPEIAALRAECSGAKRFAAAEHASQLPRITALGSAGRTLAGDPGMEGNYAAAGINVELPIFTGGRLAARYQEALLNARAEQKRLEEEEEQVAEDVNVTWLDGQAATKKIAVTQELTASANEALELAEARFKLGSTSMVDLSQAQLNSTQAEIDCAGAKYEYQMQCVKLEYVTGALKYRTPLPGVH
jgi:outer membrane protein